MSEHSLQVALCQWLAASRILHFSIPMGGLRNKTVASKLKKEGAKKGLPDLMIPIARKGYHGLFCELKIKGGRVSPEQKKWHEDLKAQGYAVEVCVGLDESFEKVKNYLA